MRSTFLAPALATALLFASGVARAEAHTETVKIGTLAPAESPWGKVLKVWQRAVRERTKLADGAKTVEGKEHTLDVIFYWNAQQGDESACVAKMRSGQLDGAAVTAIGLSQVYKPILVLQLPGLFRSWDAIDKAKAAFQDEFTKAFDDAGFYLGKVGDLGLAHSMSRGFAVRSPADLRGRKPYIWRDDPVAPVVMQVLGGVTPVPLGVPEVLPNLNSGAIDVVNVPALAAEQLQWASRLDHMGLNVSGAGIGGLLLTKKKLEALSADQRAIFEETGKVAQTALGTMIRREDGAAFERLKGKMTTYDVTDAALQEWAEIFKQVRLRLGQGTFPKEMIDRAEALAK